LNITINATNANISLFTSELEEDKQLLY